MNTAGQLSEVAARLAALRERRDELVRLRHAEGASLRQIADEAGLSHSGVKRVLERSR